MKIPNSIIDQGLKDHGIFQINMKLEQDSIESTAKISTLCDNCKGSIDTSKPKPTKGKDGKTVKPAPNPGIEASLSASTDSEETKQYHFCDEECLRQYLNKRHKK
jgi:hypothetical protein